MKKRFLKLAVGTTLALCVQQAMASTNAPNLLDVFNQSLANDPQWLAYKSTLLSNKENEPINLALLLPNLSISGTSEYNNRNQRATIPFSAPGFGVGDFQYGTNNYSIQLTQTLFNFGNWEQFQAAKAGVKQAVAQYGAQYQALMVQVAQAYFNILQARDVLNYTIIQRKAVNQLYEQNLERYRVGLGTITDVYNAKADLDNTISEEIGAKTNLLNTIEALRALTAHNYKTLAGLRDNIPLLKPHPENVETWVSIAADQNLTVIAGRFAADAQREVVKQQFAGHLPQVNAIASYSELHTGNNGFGTTDEGDGAVGIQLTMPLFAGGGVVAQTQQAQYNYQTALSNLQEAIRTAIQNTRTSYNNVISGVSRVKADKSAIVSNTSSLESTEAAFKVGTRSITDVLSAQTQLFNTQVTYATDLYAYIMSILQLKQAAGTLTPQDLVAINHWLTQNAPLTGFYESPYTEMMPKALTPSALQYTPQATPAQQQEMKNAIQSLPVFTPQPKTPWTMPTPTTSTPGVNPPNPTTIPTTVPTQPAVTAPIMPDVNPANPQFVPPVLSQPGTTAPAVTPPAATTPNSSNAAPQLPAPRFASPPADTTVTTPPAPANNPSSSPTPAATNPTTTAPNTTAPVSMAPKTVAPVALATPSVAIPTPDFATAAPQMASAAAIATPVTIPKAVAPAAPTHQASDNATTLAAAIANATALAEHTSAKNLSAKNTVVEKNVAQNTSPKHPSIKSTPSSTADAAAIALALAPKQKHQEVG